MAVTWKELAYADHVHPGVGTSYPTWQILAYETIVVGDRQEYAINSGLLDNAGTITLGSGAILLVQ